MNSKPSTAWRLCLLLFSLRVLVGHGAQPLPEGTQTLRDLAYVPDGHDRQKLDLYLPPAQNRLPLVVWIHGGAFRAGSKDQCPALWLLREGYAVASINYRLSQHAIFPAQIEDCKAAVRFLRANAPKYQLDPDRFGVWGASAGGHLAAMLGTTSDLRAFDRGAHTTVSSRVHAVVDWFGPTDFTLMNKFPGAMDHDAPDSPESQLIGGPVQENRDKAQKANPVTYVTAEDPPFLIMHGDKDPLVPVNQSQLLEAALRKAGVPVVLHVIAGAGHGFQGDEPLRLVREFFAQKLKGQPSPPTGLRIE